MRYTRFLAHLAVVSAGIMMSPAASAKQIALLIGNQGYGPEFGALANPIKDVKAIAAALEKIGVAKADIRVVTDANAKSMQTALDEHTAALKAAGTGAVGIIYYSGHSIASGLDRRNYLVAVDEKRLDENFWKDGFTLNTIIGELEGKARTASHLIFFDACRKTASTPPNSGTGCIPLAPRTNMLIAYSGPTGTPLGTKEGEKAKSPDEAEDWERARYASILAAELAKPGHDHVTLIEAISKESLARGAPGLPWSADGLRTRIGLGKSATDAGGAATGGSDGKADKSDVNKDPTTGLKSGETFSDCPVCPKMVFIPAGTFKLGSPDSEPGHKAAESPQMDVTIAKPFAIGKFEVSFDEWDACVADGGCKHRPDDEYWGRGRRPAIDVSWNDITNEYLPWLSKKTGHEYRLPSETEWEYAARAGTTTPFWWGGSITALEANYDAVHVYEGGGEKGDYRGRTSFIDEFKPNAWGLHNVHGNVWEWTADCWNDTHEGNPADGSARTTGICNRRVVRGGALFLKPDALRSAYRNWLSANIRYNDYGFRVARTLKP